MKFWKDCFYAFFGFSPLGQSPTFTHLSRWRPDPVQRPSPAKRRHKMNQKWTETFAHLFTSFEANSAIICGQQVCRIIQNSRLLGLQVRLDLPQSGWYGWQPVWICHDLSHLFCIVLGCLRGSADVYFAALNVLPPCFDASMLRLSSLRPSLFSSLFPPSSGAFHLHYLPISQSRQSFLQFSYDDSCL